MKRLTVEEIPLRVIRNWVDRMPADIRKEAIDLGLRAEANSEIASHERRKTAWLAAAEE